MKDLVRKLLTFIVVVILLCVPLVISAPEAKAAADFSHKIRANYDLLEDKSAKVEFFFTTTNKIDNNYLQTFAFKLPFEPIEIDTNNSPTEVKLKEVKSLNVQNQYNLVIDITKPVYGLNKSFDWKVSFKVKTLVMAQGLQNAIVIPSFNDEPNIEGFDINVVVPKSLGDVRYIFGNNTKQNLENGGVRVSYSSNNNDALNFLIMTGKDQEYYFETSTISKDTSIHLPLINSYQDVIFTQFPERTIISKSKETEQIFTLKKDEGIKAYLRLNQEYEKSYIKEFDDISSNNAVQTLLKSVDQSTNDKTRLARQVFDQLRLKYELGDVVTDVNTSINITTDKKRLNSAELNKVFRETLTALNIENRGVFGYVYPIQVSQRDVLTAQQNVWSEFWDGEKWVVVDPTWYLSSKGTDYFDKNAFNHIKFGTYHNISDLKSFFINAELLKIVPKQFEDSLEKKLEVAMFSSDSTYLTKEFRFAFVNKSNQPIRLKKLVSGSNASTVSVQSPEINLNQILHPNSRIDLALPLNYGLIVSSRKASLTLKLEFENLNKETATQTYENTFTVKSNISRYIVRYGLPFILLLGIIIGGFAAFKHRVRLLELLRAK